MLPTFNKRNYDRRNNSHSPFGSIDPAVIKWRKNAKSAGAEAISNKTMLAMDEFYKGLKRTGIYYKMISLNCYVPDNLIASITPLIHIDNRPYDNVAFIASDLNLDGLKGDGTSKYLKTRVNPTLHLKNNASGGLTMYSVQPLSENAYSMGSQDSAGTQVMILYYVFSTNVTIVDLFDISSRLSIANLGYTGYISANRVTASKMDLYMASPIKPHVSAIRDLTAKTGVRPNFETYVHVANTGGSASSWSSRRYSFSAIHEGLTEDESRKFYHFIHNLRRRLGGGYIV